MVCFKRHLYFQSSLCLILLWFCSKPFACSVSLTRSDIFFWGRSVARSAANTLKNSSTWWSTGATPSLYSLCPDVGSWNIFKAVILFARSKPQCLWEEAGRARSPEAGLLWFWSITHHPNGVWPFNTFYLFLLGTCVWLKYLLQRTVGDQLLTETWMCHILLDFSPLYFWCFISWFYKITVRVIIFHDHCLIQYQLSMVCSPRIYVWYDMIPRMWNIQKRQMCGVRR